MTEIEELRAEIAKLREEIAGLRADRSIHHYHHGPSPLEPQIPRYVHPWPQPMYPLLPPYPQVTCGGQAVGIGTSSWNEAQ